MSEHICQSCAMPMNAEDFGTNKDGSTNAEYCKYCLVDGEFQGESTLEGMIASCIPFMVEEGRTEAEARAMLEASLPQLKRWSTAG